MDFKTWLVRIDHDKPLHNSEEHLLEAIGQESEYGEVVRRSGMPHGLVMRIVVGLKNRGILKLENRNLSGEVWS